MYFGWIQLKDAIQTSWKGIVKQESSVNNDLLTLDNLVNKAERCFSVDKLASKELYSILSLKNNKKGSSVKSHLRTIV